MMRALKILGHVAETLLIVAFGVVLFVLAPVLFWVWLGLGVAVALFCGIVLAVRAGVRLGMEGRP